MAVRDQIWPFHGMEGKGKFGSNTQQPFTRADGRAFSIPRSGQLETAQMRQMGSGLLPLVRLEPIATGRRLEFCRPDTVNQRHF